MREFWAEMETKKILTGHKYREELGRGLSRCGFEPVYVPDNPYVDRRLSGHADLSIFIVGKTAFLSDYLKNTAVEGEFLEKGFDIIYPDSKQGSIYPEDVGFNGVFVKNYAVLNRKSICKEIVNFLTFENIPIYNVNQGYTGCSTLVLDSGHIITGDDAIYKILLKNNIRALKIDNSFIRLAGFDNGFIGGCGFSAENTLYLSGVLDYSEDKNRILDFISEACFSVQYLTDMPLFDFGKAFII